MMKHKALDPDLVYVAKENTDPDIPGLDPDPIHLMMRSITAEGGDQELDPDQRNLGEAWKANWIKFLF